jgi:hypothetical protein
MTAGPRALRLGDVVDGIIRIYRRRPVLLLAISAVFQVPVLLVTVPLGARLAASMTRLLGFSPVDPPAVLPDSFPPFEPSVAADLAVSLGALIVVGMVVGALTTATLALAIAEVGSGRSATAIAMLGRTARRLPALLLGQILYLGAVGAVFVSGLLLVSVLIGLAPDPASGGALVFLGLIVLVGVLAVTVFLALRLGFWPQSVAVEGDAAFGALRRSWRVVSGSTWRVLGFAVALGLIDYLLTVLLSQLGGTIVNGVAGGTDVGVTARLAWNVIITVVVAPIVPVGMTLLFFDLRRGLGEAPLA